MNHSHLALEITDVHYTYVDEWTRKSNHLLKGLSLNVHAGESFGFLGHNGAGKTTTIKLILGLIRANRGKINIFGQDWHLTSSRASVGYLPEHPYFYDHLSVQEMMDLYACLAGVPAREQASAVTRALEQVGMLERRTSRMRALSKGLTQRVALAQAIVARPQLLILDEPFSGLDPIGRREFRELLTKLKQDGCTIFMSSHILSDVEFLCDRASIMVKGEIKGIFNLRDRPAELSSSRYELVVERPETIIPHLQGTQYTLGREHRFTRFQFTDRHEAERALQRALETSAGVESFEHVYASLEQVFMLVSSNSGLMNSQQK